jgi:LysM repeat protein
MRSNLSVLWLSGIAIAASPLLIEPLALGQLLLFPTTINSTPSVLAQAGSSTYRVVLGDTLWGISRRSGIPLRVLIALNRDRVPDPDLIRVGQVLRFSDNLSIASPEAPQPTVASPVVAPKKRSHVARRVSRRHQRPSRTQVAATPKVQAPVAPYAPPRRQESSLPAKTAASTNQDLSDLSSAALARRRRSVLANLPSMQLSGNRLGAAKRGSCAAPGQRLVALLPDTNLGQTVSDLPTFFWSMPELKPEWQGHKLRGRFRLNAVDGEGLDINPPIYTTEFDAGSSGISSLVIEQPLPENQNLRWTLILVCDPDDPDGNEFARGWIRRVKPSPELAAELEKASLVDYPAIYAKAGLWFDALKYLAAIRRKVGDAEIADEWANLMKQIDLGTLSNKPLSCQRSPEGANQDCSAVAPK